MHRRSQRVPTAVAPLNTATCWEKSDRVGWTTPDKGMAMFHREPLIDSIPIPGQDSRLPH